MAVRGGRVEDLVHAPALRPARGQDGHRAGLLHHRVRRRGEEGEPALPGVAGLRPLPREPLEGGRAGQPRQRLGLAAGRLRRRGEDRPAPHRRQPRVGLLRAGELRHDDDVGLDRLPARSRAPGEPARLQRLHPRRGHHDGERAVLPAAPGAILVSARGHAPRLVVPQQPLARRREARAARQPVADGVHQHLRQALRLRALHALRPHPLDHRVVRWERLRLRHRGDTDQHRAGQHGGARFPHAHAYSPFAVLVRGSGENNPKPARTLARPRTILSLARRVRIVGPGHPGVSVRHSGQSSVRDRRRGDSHARVPGRERELGRRDGAENGTEEAVIRGRAPGSSGSGEPAPRPRSSHRGRTRSLDRNRGTRVVHALARADPRTTSGHGQR
jgi:hypothetical protein